MSITFRSDSNGYDTGFLGIISLHTKQNCASRTKRQQQIDRYPPIEVPITHLCDDKECVRECIAKLIQHYRLCITNTTYVCIHVQYSMYNYVYMYSMYMYTCTVQYV